MYYMIFLVISPNKWTNEGDRYIFVVIKRVIFLHGITGRLLHKIFGTSGQELQIYIHTNIGTTLDDKNLSGEKKINRKGVKVLYKSQGRHFTVRNITMKFSIRQMWQGEFERKKYWHTRIQERILPLYENTLLGCHTLKTGNFVHAYNVVLFIFNRVFQTAHSRRNLNIGHEALQHVPGTQLILVFQ